MHLISSSCQPPRDETDAGDGDRGDGAFYGRLEVLGETGASTKPSERPFDEPALGQNLKALGVIGALDDSMAHWPILSSAPRSFFPA